MRHTVSLLVIAACAGPAWAQSGAEPTWEESATIKVGPQAGKLTIADFNKDGRADLAVACGACCGDSHCADGGHIAVLLGDGKGGLASAGAAMKIGPTALCVAAGDVNGDGTPDLVAGEHDTYRVSVMIGDGAGGFAAAPGSPFVMREGTRPHTHDLVVGDVNGDGRADVVAINANDNTISVLAGDGKGAFSPVDGSPFAAGRHPYEGLRIIDVDGDRDLDAVVSNVGSRAVNVLLNDGKGRFAPAPGTPFSLGERPGYVNAADLNGDLKVDIVSTHDDSGLVKVLLGDGRSAFSPGPELTADANLWGTALADMDGDGRCDLVAAAWAGRVLVYRGDGSGGFGPRRVELEMEGRPSYVAVADFNGDGRPDIAASGYQAGTVRVWIRK